MRKGSDHRCTLVKSRCSRGLHSIGPRMRALLTASALAWGALHGDSFANDAQSEPMTVLQGWMDDDLDGLRQAMDAQCALRRPPPGWSQHCAALNALPAAGDALRAWIARHFTARPLTGPAGTVGLITGYHEPEIAGSRTRSARFTVPLYRFPGKDHPYARATRAAIESGAGLAGQALAWVEDPVDAFFLQVQGSGRIRLENGSVLRVGYAANNGHAYRAVGSVLVARGAMRAEQVDAPAIKAWLREHPTQARQVMHENPRYIFFRELDPGPAHRGPPGSLGVPLTPLRSIATDPQRVPPGALLWLDTTDPLDRRPLRRLVLAQDTGAAIVGEVRADLFWGSGPQAEQAAGLMKQPGRLWLLEPRGR